MGSDEGKWNDKCTNYSFKWRDINNSLIIHSVVAIPIFSLSSLILHLAKGSFALCTVHAVKVEKIERRSVRYADAVCFDSVLTLPMRKCYVQDDIAHCHGIDLLWQNAIDWELFSSEFLHNTSESSSSHTNSICKKKVCLFRCVNVTVHGKNVRKCVENCCCSFLSSIRTIRWLALNDLWFSFDIIHCVVSPFFLSFNVFMI